MVMTLANWYLDHKSLGRVTVGRLSTATAGITGIDLGGVGVAANVNLSYWNGSFVAQGLAGGPGGNTSWGELLGGGVGGSTLSRANAIMYTSPTMGGFSVSAAWGENDLWDVALRYAGEFGGFRIAAGIGYASNLGNIAVNEQVAFLNGEPDHPTFLKGSVSVLHVGTGLFANFAYVNRDNDGLPTSVIAAGTDNTVLYFGQAGISKNWTGLGNTVLYGEYGFVENGISNTSEATVWGLGIVQNLDAAAMELYLSYRNYSGENAGVEAKDMDIVMGGARIKF
jgi:hypothetical protein